MAIGQLIESERRAGGDRRSVAPVTLRPSANYFFSEAAIRGSSSTYATWIKPFFDRLTAAIVLTIVAIPMALVALAVLISLGRPIYFRQERVGRHGRPFVVLKFRSMHPERRTSAYNVSIDRRILHKDPNDPRLTPVGKFIRKWSLDELPQLLNVLKGDMSIVGPRPEMVHIVSQYPDELHQRHLVRPGMTGPWQISKRAEGPMHENGELDIQYPEVISFATDVKILVKTPLAVLGSQRGV